MSNGPSSNALNKRISFFRWSPTPQDADAAPRDPSQAYGTPIADGVRCGIHLRTSVEVTDESNRASVMNTWHISMGQFVALKLRDMGVFTLDGITHRVFVDALINRSGRDRAYKVICVERL